MEDRSRVSKTDLSTLILLITLLSGLGCWAGCTELRKKTLLLVKTYKFVIVLVRDSQEKKLVEKLVEKFVEKFVEIYYTGKMEILE